VVFVTEKDYPWVQSGRIVRLVTDAWPDTRFEGRITRISPIFRQATRQARVELMVDNPDHRLKPGMFIRASVALDRVPDAIIVPEQAITRRNERTGVFVVAADGQSVAWRDVRTGIRDGDRVQVEGSGLDGRVVILGQQLLDDGSRNTIPDEESQISSATGEAAAQ